MILIIEELSNSFLNYADERNPTNILHDLLLATVYSPDQIDYDQFALINEYCIELVEEPENV